MGYEIDKDCEHKNKKTGHTDDCLFYIECKDCGYRFNWDEHVGKHLDVNGVPGQILQKLNGQYRIRYFDNTLRHDVDGWFSLEEVLELRKIAQCH